VAIEQFQKWYESRHEYQKAWKERTGKKMVGYFCSLKVNKVVFLINFRQIYLNMI
jgi:benzoyl-CoA reductase subunit C